GLGRHGVAGDVDQAAVDPGAVVLRVEDGTAADEGEVLLAGLGDPLAVLEQLGVEVVDDDLPPADAAVLVAPGGERDGGVVHLLVQAGALGGAPVGHDAEADLLGGQPDLGGLPGLAVPAALLELAEAPAVEPAAALVAPAGRRPGGG